MRAAIIVVVILAMIRASFSSSERGAEPLLLSILELTDWKDAGDKGFPGLNSGKSSELTNSRKSLSY